MTERAGRVWRLAHYAAGPPGPEHFSLREEPAATPGAGQALVRAYYFGMDAFPRIRMNGDSGRAPQIPLGEIMIGRGIGRVVEAPGSSLEPGTWVFGELGWRDWAVVPTAQLKPLDVSIGPPLAHLTLLGPPGLAAWCALIDRGGVRESDTVLISAAAGAVGSIMAQIARLKAKRVIGIGGGAAQLAFLRSVGVDAALDYLAMEPLAAQIRTAAPEGVQLFVDLVGGEVFDAGLAALATHGRVVLVGTVSDYNLGAGEANVGPRPNLSLILKRAWLSGFLLADHEARFPEALHELAEWSRSGAVRQEMRIVEGFERAPEAFAGLFGAEFVGKQVVRVRDEEAPLE